MPEPIGVARVCDALLKNNPFFSSETETGTFTPIKGKSTLVSEGSMLHQRQKEKDASFFLWEIHKDIYIYILI